MDSSVTIQATEEGLAGALKSKNAKVVSILYQRYADALYGVICRIVSDDHLAEDILQEAFVKIWNNGNRYDTSKGRLFTWMMNICRNLAIDKLRSKGYKTSKKTVTDETSVYESDNIYDNIKPDTIGIRDIVNKLKPEWKHIIDLVYFSGYTHQEVSEELSIPLGTVKTRLRSAIIYLRQEI